MPAEVPREDAGIGVIAAARAIADDQVEVACRDRSRRPTCPAPRSGTGQAPAGRKPAGERSDAWRLLQSRGGSLYSRPLCIRDRDEAATLSISRSENACRGRRPAGHARQRQAPGRRPVADADAQHALRAARPRHRPQPRRRAVRHQGDRRRARDRRHDAPARPRILRPGEGEMPAAAPGDHAHRPPPDPQPRHHRRLALPSRSGGRAGLGRGRARCHRHGRRARTARARSRSRIFPPAI